MPVHTYLGIKIGAKSSPNAAQRRPTSHAENTPKNRVQIERFSTRIGAPTGVLQGSHKGPGWEQKRVKLGVFVEEAI